MYRLLRARTEGLKQDLIDFATELVRTPSPTLGEGDVADRVRAEMQKIGYDRIVTDDAGNVAGVSFGREAGPTVLLTCHMDTVAPGSAQAWTESPLSGKIMDGRLFGRGAADCKAGLAAQVYVGCLLKRSLLPMRGNLVVAATVAEENGSSAGVRGLFEDLLPSLDLKPDIAILGEPTNLGLYYGHDGWMEIEIEVEGANPFHVDSAAAAIFQDLQGGAATDRSRGNREELAVHAPRYRETGGIKQATLRIDRRLQSSEQVEGVLEQVRHGAALVAQAAGTVAVKTHVRREQQRLYTGLTTVVQHVTHAWATDPFHPLMSRTRQALEAAGCHAEPGKWRLGRLGMGTAGGVFVNEFNVPAIGYGPGDEELAHAPNESVELERIAECVYGTAAIVHALAGVPVFGWTSDEY